MPVSLDSSCCATEMHRKLSGQIQGREHSRGSSGCGERKGALTRQEDVIVNQISESSAAGELDLLLEKDLPQIHQVQQTLAVVFFLFVPLGY